MNSSESPLSHKKDWSGKSIPVVKRLITCGILIFINAFALSAQTSRIDSLKLDALRLKGDTGLVWTYIRLGISYQSINYDSSLYFMRLSNKAARETSFTKGIAASHMRLGNTFLTLSEFDSALFHYNISGDIYREENNLISQSKVFNNLGLVSQKKGDYTKSIQYYLRALEIKQQLNDEWAGASTSHNIGIVFALQKDYRKAEKYMLQAMTTLERLGDSSTYYGVVDDYALLLFEMKDYETSWTWTTRSLRYHKEFGLNAGIARGELNAGKIMVERDDFNSAIYHFNKSKKLYTKLGAMSYIQACNLELSKAYYGLGKYTKARELADESLAQALPAGSKQSLLSVYGHLAKVYAALDDYRKAFEFQKKYQNYKDSLVDEEKHRTILELEGKYKDEKQQREIEALKAEKAVDDLIKKKRESQTYVLYGILVLTLVSGVVFWFRYWEKRKSNLILQEKSGIIENSLQEKEVLLREIHHRVQNNLQFVSSLISLQSRDIADKKTVQLLNECRARIQSMAMIHQKLYQEDSLKGIKMDNYVRNLIDTISKSYNLNNERIEVITEIDPVELDINTAIPVGLIFNELITNAYKYAFESRQGGRLLVSLRQDKSKLHLTVQDDGIGLPEDYDLSNGASFGMKLVKSLAAKLKAKLDIKGGIGTTVRMEIAEYE